MKTRILISSVFFFLILSAFKQADIKQFQSVYNHEFSIPEDEHVELMDGKIIIGNVTKCNLFKNNTFKRRGEGEVIIDEVKYDFDNLKAVKFKKKYYRKLESGDDFALRITEGKINTYVTWSQTGSSSSKTEYIQKGDKGPLVYLYGGVRDMVKDNPKCVEMFDFFDKQSKRKQSDLHYFTYHECVKIYNDN